MVLVAHHGDGENSRSCSADALQQAAEQHHRKVEGENRDDAAGDKDAEAGVYGGLPAEAVRNRAINHLRRGKT